MRKTYQNQEIDTSQPAVPDTVSVALAELAGEMREGLLALAVGTGLQVMAAIMEADVVAACGPRGRHDPERTATRHGHGPGSVSLGTKHPLSLVEGSTENATLVTELIVGLRERGLDVTKPILAVLDGSKALRRAVLDVFDRPVIGRCQLHKIRNVEDHLPEKLRTTVASRMRRAYHADSALAAEAELCALAAELDRTHPGAAASLREGMAETLTVLRLGVPPTLARTLRSTNAVESMISICRTHASNVKNWRDGQMALRWCAAGMVEAGKQFRRVNGHLHLRSLRDTLEKVTQPVGATAHTDAVTAA